MAFTLDFARKVPVFGPQYVSHEGAFTNGNFSFCCCFSYVELQYVCTNRRLLTGVASRLFWHNCVRSSLPHLLNLIIWVYFVRCAKSPSGSKHKGLGPVNAWSCLNSVLTTTLRADWFQGFHSAIFFFKLYYSYFSSRVSLITSGFVQTVTIMSNQYVHARNHQSKSLTTILGLPRNAILPAIHDFPGGPGEEEHNASIRDCF